MTINKITLKKLVEFRRYSERRQATFASQLTIPKNIVPSEGGGDYWKRSMSALGSAFKNNDNTKIQEKIDAVLNVYKSTTNNLTKKMYERNVELLQNYTSFDFSTLRPLSELTFLPKSKEPLTMDNIPLQIIPSHVFSFTNDNRIRVGGIWFVAWREKFSLEDLGIFSEGLYKHLDKVYSNKFEIDPNYCLTVDILTMEVVPYAEIMAGRINSQLQTSVNLLHKYLD